jgi:hypothetical protein
MLEGEVMNKYKNKKAVVDGITFDSKKEAARYINLKCLEDAGLISDLQRQVSFELIPPQKLPQPYKEGTKMVRTLRGCSYKADFVYMKQGLQIVEDVKSAITRHNPEYIIKKKLMLYRYGIQIMEV